MTRLVGSVVADVVRTADGTTVERTREHTEVGSRFGRIRFGARDRALNAVVAALAAGPVTRAELEAVALAGRDEAEDPVVVLARLDWLLHKLGGGLLHSVAHGGRELARVVPLTGDGGYDPGPVPEGPVALSRLAFLRRRATGAVLESGRALFRVELCAPEAIAVAAALTDPAPKCRFSTLPQKQKMPPEGGTPQFLATNLRPARRRRGNACISCRSRKGRPRCGRPCPRWRGHQDCGSQAR